MYPYGVNEKVETCEDDKKVKRFKSDDGIVEKLFPSLARLFQRGKTRQNNRRKGIFTLNYELLIIKLGRVA